MSDYINKEEKEEVMAGVFLPQPMHLLLDLHAVYEGTSRSEILRDLVSDWILKKRKNIKPTSESGHIKWLIKEIARKSKVNIAPFLSILEADEIPKVIHEHKKEVKARLSRRLPDNIVEEIIKEITFEENDFDSTS